MDLFALISLATSVIPDRSLGFTITVIVAGLGIVLGTLAILIVVFYAFGAIMTAAGKVSKKKKQAAPSPAIPVPKLSDRPVTKAVETQPSVNQGVSAEVVAAISAAVYSMEGSDARITAIVPARKQNPVSGRNPWAQAAVVNNTKPF